MTVFDPSQVGFWVLALPTAVMAARAGAALYLRPKRLRLSSLAAKVLSDPRANVHDRAWLAVELRSATHNTYVFAAAAIPALSAVALAESVKEVRASRNETIEQTIDRLRDESSRIKSEIVKIVTGVDPTKGNLWGSESYAEISQLSHEIEAMRTPIALLWVLLWLLPSFGIMFFGHLFSKGTRALLSQVKGQADELSLSSLLRIRFLAYR